MINSLILETYSPIIIPLSFIYSINHIEREFLLGNTGILGFVLLILSLLIYYDRAYNHNEKGYLLAGIIGLAITYYMYTLVYSKFINFSLVLLFLCLMGYSLTDMDIYSSKNQYIYLSLFLLLLAFTLFIPYEREYLRPYNLSLLFVSLSITILVFTTVKTPTLK